MLAWFWSLGTGSCMWRWAEEVGTGKDKDEEEEMRKGRRTEKVGEGEDRERRTRRGRGRKPARGWRRKFPFVLFYRRTVSLPFLWQFLLYFRILSMSLSPVPDSPGLPGYSVLPKEAPHPGMLTPRKGFVSWKYHFPFILERSWIHCWSHTGVERKAIWLNHL